MPPDEIIFDENLYFQSDWTFARPRPFEQLSHTTLSGGGPPVRGTITHRDFRPQTTIRSRYQINLQNQIIRPI